MVEIDLSENKSIILEYIFINLFGLDQMHDYKAERLFKNIPLIQSIFRSINPTSGGKIFTKKKNKS